MASPLDIYEAFLITAEEMNFTRAAQRLFITQQSLSGRIHHLEEMYQTRLFDRKPNLKLTPSGERMVFHARLMLEENRTLTEELAGIDPDSSAILRLGISQQRSLVFLKDIWTRFNDIFPNISLRTSEILSLPLLDELIDHKLDLAIGVNISPSANLLKTPLALECPCCIVRDDLLKKYQPQAVQDSFPPAHSDEVCAFKAEASSSGTDITAPDEIMADSLENLLTNASDRHIFLPALDQIPLTMLPEGSTMRVPIMRQFAEAGKAPNILLETLETELILETVKSGRALAVLSPMVLYHYRKAGTPLPSDCHVYTLAGITPIEVSLIQHRTSMQTPYIKKLADIIVSEFEKYRFSFR